MCVDLDFVEAEARDVETCRRDARARVEGEVATQNWARIRARRVFEEIGGDPPRVPVGAIEEAGFEEGFLTPGGRVAFIVPDADLPVVACARAKRRSCVWPEGRGARGDAPGTP